MEQHSSFPIDITSEILLRLPEKSVARFRCVSKLWLSITTDPYFINLFETRYPRPSLLVCFKEDDNMFVSSIPQHHHSLQNSKKTYSSSQPICSYHMKFPKGYSYIPLTESVHGLICFKISETMIVWNPSTRQFLTLPKPSYSCIYITIFLGYDPVEGKHKVICIPFPIISDVCGVLTLGSAQESWRTVKNYYKHRCFYPSTSGRCIKGVVYYIAYDYDTSAWVIMSFDVRSEKFHMIQLPSDIYMDFTITYEGKLACVKKFTTKDGKIIRKHGITLCILEDAKKHKWSSKDVLAPSRHYDESLRTYFNLKGCTHDGEFIYVSSMLDYILFCDPVKNSFRRFELKGIADDKYRLDNGVEDGRVYMVHAFPNHFDSQITLI